MDKKLSNEELYPIPSKWGTITVRGWRLAFAIAAWVIEEGGAV